MKLRILAASLVLVVCFSGASIAIAKAPTKQEIKQYVEEYNKARHEFGADAVGCNLIGRRGKCHVKATRARVENSLGVIDRLLYPKPTPPPPTSSQAPSNYAPVSNSGVLATVSGTNLYTPGVASGDLSNVPGVPSSFASCVAFRESTDGKLSSNIYGLQSYYSGESLMSQKQTMSQMYASRNVEPWQPYDHCG